MYVYVRVCFFLLFFLSSHVHMYIGERKEIIGGKTLTHARTHINNNNNNNNIY